MKKSTKNSIYSRNTFASTSSAQNAILCSDRSALPNDPNYNHASNIMSLQWNDLDKAVGLLCFRHGLRISEILQLTVKEMLPGSKILVKALKGSQNRIIYDDFVAPVLYSFLQHNLTIGSIFSRFYYYRLFNSAALGVQFVSSSKKSVTHAGRHLIALSLKASEVSIDDIRGALGHRNERSTTSYLSKRK